MAATPFGEHLKRERELRGVSLDEIALATRIKTTFLEALESGRWQELPGGAFNRGFVRSTARFLGLDEDGMVAEYALETNGTSQNRTVAEPSGAMPRDYRPAAIAAAALLLLLVAGAWFAHYEYVAHRQKQAAALAASVNSAAPSGAAAVTGASSPDGLASNAAVLGTAVNDSAATRAASGTTDAATNLTPTPKPAETPLLTLKIEASQRVSARIVADGKTLFKGRLRSDDPKTFRARDGFEVTTSDSSVVQLELNGQTISLQDAGRRGTISLGRKDLKPAAETSH
jgi:cytoskeleton protein RodZ